jgi:hypothetical protein
MRTMLRSLAELGNEDASDEELDRLVDESMAEDPRLFILIINCYNGNEFTVSLNPSVDATYADVPFEPGTYTIAGGSAIGSDASSTEFTALVTIGDGLYDLSEPGQLVISRWDEEGIEGSFSFAATESFAEGAPKNVSVEAKFEFDCVGGSRCER